MPFKSYRIKPKSDIGLSQPVQSLFGRRFRSRSIGKALTENNAKGSETMTEAGELEAQVSQQIVTAMKAHDAERTGTLRLIKNALKNKAIEKRAALTQAESEQTLATMIKQRRDSIEQFAKGNRQDLVAKEQAEIVVIEEFLPKALDEAGVAKLVSEAVGELTAAVGHKPTQKEMGPAMKAVQGKLQAAGLRADGRLVSELVKKELAG